MQIEIFRPPELCGYPNVPKKPTGFWYGMSDHTGNTIMRLVKKKAVNILYDE